MRKISKTKRYFVETNKVKCREIFLGSVKRRISYKSEKFKDDIKWELLKKKETAEV